MLALRQLSCATRNNLFLRRSSTSCNFLFLQFCIFRLVPLAF